MADPHDAKLGPQLVSYALDELDDATKQDIDEQLVGDERLRDELDEIRSHMNVHRDVRSVAPRRGSFERLRRRMKAEGAMDAAVPGVHCMLRRAFVVSAVVGILFVIAIAMFTENMGTLTEPDVIGQIIYRRPASTLGTGDEVDSASLELSKNYDTGSYEAWLWLPTGVSNRYSTVAVGQNSEFAFTSTREISLKRGSVRRIEVERGDIGDGSFIVNTPHGRVEIDQGSASITVRADGAATEVTVGKGAARVFGKDSDKKFLLRPGYCTLIERDSLPEPPHAVLGLAIRPKAGSRFDFEVTLRNTGFEPIRVARALAKDPVYVLAMSHTAEFRSEGGLPENVTLPQMRITPKPDIGQTTDAHRGEIALDPERFYRFTFDVSPMLIDVPKVEYWLRVEYRGDLYGPQGQAKVRIYSKNIKMDLRDR